MKTLSCRSINWYQTVLAGCFTALAFFVFGCGVKTKSSVRPAVVNTHATRIYAEVEARLLSDVKEAGEFSDSEFLSQKKNDLLLNFDQRSPEIDETKIVSYIFQNLVPGTWVVDLDDTRVFSDGEKVAVGNVTVTIKDGYEYLGFRFKRLHKEALRLFNEKVILEIVRVGVRIHTSPTKGVEIEIARLYPINSGGVTDEMLSELVKKYTAPEKK